MERWLIYSIISLLLWGVWGFLCKLATMRGLDWRGMYIFTTLSGIVTVGYLLFSTKLNIIGTFDSKMIAVSAGIAGTAAVIFFYSALISGKLSIVMPLTSLYPALTILLAVFVLKEKLNSLNILGIVLAMVSIFLLSHK